MTKLTETITTPGALLEHVEGILATCRYDWHRVADTTTILSACVDPNDHVLGIGSSATVFPERFDATLGVQYAKDDARAKAKQALFDALTWQLRAERAEVE